MDSEEYKRLIIVAEEDLSGGAICNICYGKRRWSCFHCSVTSGYCEYCGNTRWVSCGRCGGTGRARRFECLNTNRDVSVGGYRVQFWEPQENKTLEYLMRNQACRLTDPKGRVLFESVESVRTVNFGIRNYLARRTIGAGGEYVRAHRSYTARQMHFVYEEAVFLSKWSIPSKSCTVCNDTFYRDGICDCDYPILNWRQ